MVLYRREPVVLSAEQMPIVAYERVLTLETRTDWTLLMPGSLRKPDSRAVARDSDMALFEIGAAVDSPHELPTRTVHPLQMDV